MPGSCNRYLESRRYYLDSVRLAQNLLNPPHAPVSEANLYPMRVEAGAGQDLAYEATGQPTRVLILLQNDVDFVAYSYVYAVLTIQ